MFRARFHPRGVLIQKIVRDRRGKAAHRSHTRFAVGERACLVKGDASDLGEPLQRIALTDEKSVLGRIPDGRHDRRRGCEHECARTEYDQNRDSADNFPGDQPGDHCRRQRDHHDPRGPAVRDAHNFGLARVGGLYQPDHPLDGAVLAHFFGAHLKGAKLVDCSAGDLIPGLFVHGEGFPGHNRLIYGGVTG